MPNEPTVLLLSQAPGVGGGERVVLNALARSERLNVVVAGHPAVCEFADRIGLKAEVLELPWISSASRLASLPSGAVRVRGLCRRLDVDVLFGNGTRAFPYSVFARMLGGPKLIANHHGFFTRSAGIMVAGVDLFSTMIIAPTSAVAAPFRARRKIRVMPYGIDLERFSPSADSAISRKHFSIPDTSPVIGMVSRAAPGKGMDKFVSVAHTVSARHFDARFILAGGAIFPHENESFASIRERADRLLGERMVMTGIIEETESVYRALDVFVHLSDPEAYPSTAIEAMACGVPVVGFNWGGLTEIVMNGRTGLLVDPNDEEAVSEAVTRLIADPELRKSMGSAARSRCESTYSIDSYVDALEGAVLAVAGS